MWYTDEQQAFSERWRALDPRDWEFQTMIGKPAISAVHESPGDFYPERAFSAGEFWSPFADGRITKRSRLAVARQIVVVNGKAFGQINFIAWEKSSTRFLVFDVYVRTNLSLIDSQIHALFPKDDIRLSQANGSVVLSGTVSNGS